jgi:hypothetical protein
MNLCDSCARYNTTCPEPGDSVSLCVEHAPQTAEAARAAQLWHASHNDRDHWAELCRMIEAEGSFDNKRLSGRQRRGI